MVRNDKIIYIRTFGCALNQSDSEVMAGLLAQAGYIIVNEYKDDSDISDSNSDSKDLLINLTNVASSISSNNLNIKTCSSIKSINDIDLVIINTCTVKNLAESKFFKELRKWKNTNVKIVVAGCIPQAEKKLLIDKLSDVSIIGTRQISSVVSVVEDTLNGKIVHNIENNSYNERLNLPKLRHTGIIEILPISEGCIGSCSYCKTKFARGNLLSYPKDKIILQFKTALKQGCKEFWITSQDNGCYGFDIYRKEKYFLSQLLTDLLNIEGDFRIRLGMCNPDHIQFIKDDLVNVFKHPKMFKFLHIPIQSANDRVLRVMRRNYTSKVFVDIVDFFRKELPDITLSTDIIVGFPTETEEEFNDSLNLVKTIDFNVLNISRFWLRNGTLAQNLVQLPGGIIKERLIKLKSVFDLMIENKNKKWLHSEFNILIDELGKNSSLIGRDDYYRQVVIKNPSSNLILGSAIRVRIISTTKYLLIGEEIIN
jgi:threonylcarbamoyladenosine tRNA methylthiotransferase CDKAL1